MLNESFSQLLDISPKNFIFSKTFDSEFSCIESMVSDQNLLQMKLKLLQKERFKKKQQKQLVI